MDADLRDAGRKYIEEFLSIEFIKFCERNSDNEALRAIAEGETKVRFEWPDTLETLDPCKITTGEYNG